MAFATADELASHLKTTFTASEEEAAELALDRATARIQSMTGQILSAEADDVVTVVEPDGRDLWLPEGPVTAVSAVTGRSYGDTTSTTYAVNDDYTLIAGSTGLARLVRTGGRRAYWPQLVTVTYDHGFETIPDDLKDACLEVATELVANPERLTTEAIDDYRSGRASGSRETVVGPALAAAIRKYRPRGARSVRVTTP